MDSKWPSRQVILEEIRGAERRKTEEEKLIERLKQDLIAFDVESNANNKGGVHKEQTRSVEVVARL